ncbi:DHA1 family bicyclomycin/chloramphenicol resistance-like MFS transporter [Oxalobacteraceae bacterium GrIS 1.11]
MKKTLAPWAWGAILLAVVCLPRVTIDAYLPSLPAMAGALHASDAQLQWTLTLYMVGYAVSMLVCGPLSDRYGRRPVLLGGTALYLAATVACACAASAPMLIAARLLQALGGCSGTVIGRVMVRDHCAPQAQADLLSRMSMGMALSPIVAPLIGSLIDITLGWRWVFIGLAALAAVLLVLVAALLPETRPAADAADATLRRASVPRLYLGLLRERHFLRYALLISCIYCTYFPFIAESSVLLQKSLHLTETAYALVFGATVAGYLLGSNLFRRLGPRHGADTLIAWAVALNAAASTLLWLATALYPGALAALLVPMLLVMLSVGMAIPACQLAVLQPYAAIAGTASGLFFFCQMAITALCSFITGQLSDGSVRPTVWMTLAASAALCATWLALRERGTVRAATARLIISK